MSKIFLVSLFFGVIALSSRSLAGTKQVELTKADLSRLQSDLRKNNYLTVEFIHKIYSPIRSKERVLTGRAYFAKPAKFRWVKEEPIKEEIIYDGKTLLIYKPEEKVVEKFASIAAQAKEIEKISNFVLDFQKLLEEYSIVSAKGGKDKKELINIELKPKKKTDLDSVSLKISNEPSFIREIYLNYKDGKKWSFQFKNPSTEKISSDLFTFTPPKDVKVSVFE